MQFKVPQDVQRPDRIVGPLTFTQLVICIIGGGIAYGIFTLLKNQALSTVIALVPTIFVMAITLAFAFLKIANVPFHKFLALVIERVITPSKRIWIKGSDSITDEIPIEKPQNQAKEMTDQQKKEEMIKNLSSVEELLDTRDAKTPEEEELQTVDAAKDEELIPTAFQVTKPEEVKPIDHKQEKEASILELSKAPLDSDQPQKKKKRRRRKKKNKLNSQVLNEVLQTTPSWLSESEDSQKTSSDQVLPVETPPQEVVEPLVEATPTAEAPTEEMVPSEPEPVNSEAPQELAEVKPTENEEALSTDPEIPELTPEPIERRSENTEQVEEKTEQKSEEQAPETDQSITAPLQQEQNSETLPKNTESEQNTSNDTTEKNTEPVKTTGSFTPDELKEGKTISFS